MGSNAHRSFGCVAEQRRTGRSAPINREGCDIVMPPAILLLRESQQRGYMHRRSPMMRSLLSRSSKPQLLLAESVSFFGSGCSLRSPWISQTTLTTSGLASFYFANPFSRRRETS